MEARAPRLNTASVFENRHLCPVFRALANPTRMRFIEALVHGDMRQEELRELSPLRQPTVIHHLKVLETCGLLRSRREGQLRRYSLRLEALRQAEDCLRRLAAPRSPPFPHEDYR